MSLPIGRRQSRLCPHELLLGCWGHRAPHDQRSHACLSTARSILEKPSYQSVGGKFDARAIHKAVPTFRCTIDCAPSHSNQSIKMKKALFAVFFDFAPETHSATQRPAAAVQRLASQRLMAHTGSIQGPLRGSGSQHGSNPPRRRTLAAHRMMAQISEFSGIPPQSFQCGFHCLTALLRLFATYYNRAW